MLPSKNDVLSSIDKASAILLPIIECIILEPIIPPPLNNIFNYPPDEIISYFTRL